MTDADVVVILSGFFSFCISRANSRLILLQNFVSLDINRLHFVAVIKWCVSFLILWTTRFSVPESGKGSRSRIEQH